MVIRRFTGTGISLNVNHDRTIIRDSLITNNSANCISVSGERSSVKLINNTFQHNSDSSYGASVLTTSVNYYTSFYLKGNIFHNNDMQKVLNFLIRNNELSGSVIEIANNDILNNTCEYLVDVEYQGCVNYYRTDTILLANNYWGNNQVRGSSVTVKQLSFCSRRKFDVWLMENVFLNNTGRTIVDVQTRWSTSVTFDSNLLQTNVLDKSAITLKCDYQVGNIFLSHNEFFNNVAEELVDVTGNARLVGVIRKNTMEGNEIDKSLFTLFRNENLNRQNSLNFTRNSLINNAVGQRRPLPYYIINSVAAVICPSNLQISVNENFFENPLFSFEFMLTPIFEINEINAKYNWWGSKDENEIILKIFDFRWRNYLARVNFSPFLASGNLSDVHEGEAIFNFRNGSVLLGGGVTDHIILKSEDSPYTVIRDVIIYPSATLTIEKGTQINVFPNIEFHVYGKLDLLGEWDSPIEFNVATNLQGSTNFSTYPLRLVNGSRPWEGIVEIFYNNTWGTICNDGYRYSNGIVLCKQLGYQGYSGSYSYVSSSINTKPVWWRYLRCNSDKHHDISTCPFQGWGVSCYYSRRWAVRCDPGFWRGIRFRETAKTSNISHVKFERGGGYIRSDINSYVLHFDVLRQTLSDIEIRDSFRGGIKIAFHDPGLALNNILIQNSYKYTSSYGIETTSSFTCYNCSVFGKNRGLNIPEFSMNSFLHDSEIKRIDALAVPELMLRKEIRLCEQNTSVVVGKEDMKIVRMSTLSYSYEVVECFLTLTLVSQTTLVAAEMILSRDEIFTISSPNSNSSNTTEVTMSQYDVYSFGPGNLTVRYRRNSYSSSGSRKTLVLFTSKGKISLKLLAFRKQVFYVIYDYMKAFIAGV